MTSPYNTYALSELTDYTTGNETKTIVVYDFAYNDDTVNYENCMMVVDADILGSCNGEEAYFKRFNAVIMRMTDNVGFVASPIVVLGPTSTMNLTPINANLVVNGTQVQIVVTGVEGYAITWRGTLRIRIN